MSNILFCGIPTVVKSLKTFPIQTLNLYYLLNIKCSILFIKYKKINMKLTTLKYGRVAVAVCSFSFSHAKKVRNQKQKRSLHRLIKIVINI